jgi:F420-0:gamma-glutamyl ligase
MRIETIRTRIFEAGDDLAAFILEQIPREKFQEKTILAVTSKIVSLAEGCLVKVDTIDKLALVKRESDRFLAEVGYGCQLTIKHGIFIPNAGIDESNSRSGDYILFPQDPFRSAADLCQKLRDELKLRDFGVVFTDSHTTPLRKGVTGIALAHAGFQGVRSLVGTQDLFGRELRMTNMNFADGLAAATVMMMGEGSESKPLALAYETDVTFTEIAEPAVAARELQMKLEDDLYFPLFEPLLK